MLAHSPPGPGQGPCSRWASGQVSPVAIVTQTQQPRREPHQEPHQEPHRAQGTGHRAPVSSTNGRAAGSQSAATPLRPRSRSPHSALEDHGTRGATVTRHHRPVDNRPVSQQSGSGASRLGCSPTEPVPPQVRTESPPVSPTRTAIADPTHKGSPGRPEPQPPKPSPRGLGCEL